MNNELIKFKEIVDKEIQAYEAMDDLYKLKQAVLIQGKSDVLWDVDAKINTQMQSIKELTSQRKDAGKYLGSENITLSEVIEKAKNSNNALASKFQEQKTKLNLLEKSIKLCESTNLELIKHGLIMVEKTLNIFINVVSPVASQYDKFGKNVEQKDKIQVSSVVEEA